jgi:WD40 repeat protein
VTLPEAQVTMTPLVYEPITAHEGGAGSVAVTPDGTHIVSGGLDGTVRVWNLATGIPIGNPLTAHQGGVRSVAVTPDGTHIVSGGRDGKVRVWDLATGTPLGKPLTAHQGGVWSVAVTPDGTRIISGGEDGTVRVWDLATATPLGNPLTAHQGTVVTVAVTPDGTHIISGGRDGTVRVWDLATGAPVGNPLTGHRGGVWSVAVTPDGTHIISGGEDGTVRVWDLATEAPAGNPRTGVLVGHEGAVRSVAVTPDGTRIVSGGYVDGTVRVWDLATGAPAGNPLTGHQGVVRSVAVTPDGTRIVSGGYVDGTVRVWDLATGAPVGNPLTGHEGGVWSVAITPDGTHIISGGHDGTVRVRDLATGTPLGNPLTGNWGGVWSVAVTPDGTHIISGGDDGTIRVWDLTTGTPAGSPLTGHRGVVRSVAVTPDGTRIVSGGDDGTVRVWEPFGPPRVDRYAAVVTDAESAVDRLGMTADVQTLAALLAAVSTAPPLSVALMGNWGSGKSTFMGLVIKEVERLATTYSPSHAYATQVRQVRFNAWHYSDDHLWVGLIEHLFRELRQDAAPAAQPPDARERTIQLEADLAAAKARQSRSERLLREVDALDPDRGWFGRLGQIRRAWLVSRAAGADIRAQLRTRAFWWILFFAVLAVAGVLVAQVFGAQLRGLAEALGWATAAIGAAGAVTTPIRQVWDVATTWSDKARKEQLRITQEQAGTIRELEDELTRLDPGRQLAALLTEISDTNRYANYRGLTGRIHHDLQRLNQQLVTLRNGDPSRRWRIILYVDDLDRCVASRVVEVLQAINLLLSMELFLVVVAVDPRWLLRALDEHHGQLLNAKPTQYTDDDDRDKHGRPLDYLDKIFHVPYAVRPMGRHAEELLRSLLPDPEPAPGDAALTTPSRPHPAAFPLPDPPLRPAGGADTVTNTDMSTAPVTGEATADRPTPASAPAVAAASDTATATGTVTATATARPAGPISVESLRLRQAEVDFLPRLATLLPTPRSIKKLSNLYRLLRISVPADQLDAFLGEATDGPYQAAALLLAIVISEPGQARDLLTYLLASDPDTDILDALRAAPGHTGPAVQRLADAVEQLRASTPVHGSTATYQAWARSIARYSFETYEMFTEPDLPS